MLESDRVRLVGLLRDALEIAANPFLEVASDPAPPKAAPEPAPAAAEKKPAKKSPAKKAAPAPEPAPEPEVTSTDEDDEGEPVKMPPAVPTVDDGDPDDI